ncbi:hypothetical protein [Cytobacillus kochii]|uniref:hypothetical protein n=1 Tax=Cytobacillus kochii TaxID=859143 RepID=UPI00402AB1DC
MTIYSINNPLSDDGRNKINHNFEELNNNIKKTNEDFQRAEEIITEKAFDRVVDSAKIEWLPPVNTFNLLNTTYPNATTGKTVMTRDNGKVFRKEGTSWVEIQQIDAGPVNEVDSRLTAQLAETANLQNQVDYVKMVRDHNITNLKMKTRVKGDRIIEVFVPLSNNEYARYEFGKDANDDYIKLHNGETAIKSNNDLRVGKNYDTNSGIWSTSSKNHYTTQIGATFTVSFTGHKFEFCYFADTRGGVWEFVVDGDTSNKKTFSTYGSANPGVATIFTELEDTEHTVIATFKGDDPNNVPSSGAGTSRGWVYYNDGTTNYYSVFATTKGELTKQLDILYPSSNKEFAIQVSPLNSGFSPQWLPEHNAIGTVFTVDQKVMIDGVEITDWIAQPFYKEASKLQIIQKMTCKHPDDTSNPVAEIYSVHTVTSTGVSVTVKIKWLRDVSITNGYGMMFPVYTSFANELITSLKNRYPSVKTDGSSTNLVSEKDGAISFAYINNTKTDESANTIVAMTITDMKGTYRQGKSGRRSQSIAWLQHRSTELQKLYLHTFAATTALAGETYEVSGEFIIGKLPMAANLIA